MLALALLTSSLVSAAAPVRPTPRAFVIVSFDSVRADVLGAYGSTRGATPALDRLAAESVVFERAYAQAPVSLPSHASLFTGLYPRSHGAIGPAARVSTSAVLLAELLRADGSRTAAFTGGFSLQGAFGLSRGFEVYADSVPRAGLAVSVDGALEWLRGVGRDERVLLFVHGYDAHPPWHAPTDALRRFAPPGVSPWTPAETDFRALDRLCGTRLYAEAPCRGPSRELGPGAAVWLEAYYAGAVSHMDAQFARLRVGLEAAGRWESAVVVVLADHGQLLADHLEVTAAPRGELFEDSLRVPLFIRAPGVAPRRVAALVELVDVAPTVLALAGLTVPAALQGRSLAPALDGARLPAKPSVAQAGGPAARGVCAGLRQAGLLFARCPGSPDALFEPAADPRLRRDLTAARPDDAAALGSALDFWERATPPVEPAPPDAAWEAARAAVRAAAPWTRRRLDAAALRRWSERR